MRHERGERLWNVDLTRLVNDCFSLRGSLRAGSHVEIGTEYDLFDSELHGGTLLRDVPMQKAVVDIVQRRKYGDEVSSLLCARPTLLREHAVIGPKHYADSCRVPRSREAKSARIFLIWSRFTRFPFPMRI